MEAGDFTRLEDWLRHCYELLVSEFSHRLDRIHELTNRQNGNAFIGTKLQQVAIPANDKFSVARYCTFEHTVVIRVG